MSSSDSSDEEIFIKGKKQCQCDDKDGILNAAKNSLNQRTFTSTGPKAVLSERSQNMTHAEWALHNMSQSPGL